jgi:hypothetical protein
MILNSHFAGRSNKVYFTIPRNNTNANTNANAVAPARNKFLCGRLFISPYIMAM